MSQENLESLFNSGTYHLYTESDSITVNLTRHLVALSGLTKKEIEILRLKG